MDVDTIRQITDLYVFGEGFKVLTIFLTHAHHGKHHGWVGEIDHEWWWLRERGTANESERSVSVKV